MAPGDRSHGPNCRQARLLKSVPEKNPDHQAEYGPANGEGQDGRRSPAMITAAKLAMARRAGRDEVCLYFGLTSDASMWGTLAIKEHTRIAPHKSHQDASRARCEKSATS